MAYAVAYAMAYAMAYPWHMPWHVLAILCVRAGYSPPMDNVRRLNSYCPIGPEVQQLHKNITLWQTNCPWTKNPATYCSPAEP